MSRRYFVSWGDDVGVAAAVGGLLVEDMMQPHGPAFRALASSTASNNLVVLSLLLLGPVTALTLARNGGTVAGATAAGEGGASTAPAAATSSATASAASARPSFDSFDAAARPKPETLAACESVDEGATCVQLSLGSLRVIATQRTIAAVARFFGASSGSGSVESRGGARFPPHVVGHAGGGITVMPYASPLNFRSPHPDAQIRSTAARASAVHSAYAGGGANVSTIALPAPEPRVASLRLSFELAALELRLHDEGRYASVAPCGAGQGSDTLGVQVGRSSCAHTIDAHRYGSWGRRNSFERLTRQPQSV